MCPRPLYTRQGRAAGSCRALWGFPSGSQNHIGKALITAGKRREQTQQSELPHSAATVTSCLTQAAPALLPRQPPATSLQHSPGLASEPSSCFQGLCPTEAFQ